MESLTISGRHFLCPTRVAPPGNARTYCRKLGGGMVFLISRDKVGSNHPACPKPPAAKEVERHAGQRLGPFSLSVSEWERMPRQRRLQGTSAYGRDSVIWHIYWLPFAVQPPPSVTWPVSQPLPSPAHLICKWVRCPGASWSGQMLTGLIIPPGSCPSQDCLA